MRIPMLKPTSIELMITANDSYRYTRVTCALFNPTALLRSGVKLVPEDAELPYVLSDVGNIG